MNEKLAFTFTQRIILTFVKKFKLSKNNLEKIIEMKEEQCYYIDSNSHDLMTQNSVKDDESNTLKISKTNFQQNFSVQLNMINENVSISHSIQIHQNADSLSMNQVVVRYSAV